MQTYAGLSRPQEVASYWLCASTQMGEVNDERSQMNECMRVSAPGDLNTASNARSSCPLLYSLPNRSPRTFLRHSEQMNG